MNNYIQLNLNERAKIYNYLKDQLNVKKIASMLNRSPSTISRKLNTNSDHIGYLYPHDAYKRTCDKKARHKTKISKNYELKKYIIDALKEKWSPIAIAGRWSKDNLDHPIYKEFIYNFIYSKEGKEHGLYKLLLRKGKTRGMIRKSRCKETIKNRTSIP